MSFDDDPPWERPRVDVDFGRQPLLYRPDGTPLKRQIGYNVQTSGTFPELHDNKRPAPKKKGKKR